MLFSNAEDDNGFWQISGLGSGGVFISSDNHNMNNDAAIANHSVKKGTFYQLLIIYYSFFFF